ncbi:MAG: hypothetical protein ACTS8A_03855 [Arsenophonus sp. ET-LJ4-MAG3]
MAAPIMAKDLSDNQGINEMLNHCTSTVNTLEVAKWSKVDHRSRQLASRLNIKIVQQLIS